MERRRYPLDSTFEEIKQSQSQDPIGIALSSSTEDDIPKGIESILPPTPRNKLSKTEQISCNPHQREITERLYGNTNPRSTVRDIFSLSKTSKSLYLGDMLPDMPDRINTDQSEDTDAREDIEESLKVTGVEI